MEEERLQQEKELIMKEARQFLEQKRSAEERKALAMKRWESGEDESQKVQRPTLNEWDFAEEEVIKKESFLITSSSAKSHSFKVGRCTF